MTRESEYSHIYEGTSGQRAVINISLDIPIVFLPDPSALPALGFAIAALFGGQQRDTVTFIAHQADNQQVRGILIEIGKPR